ncbi:MAG: hypothetical protein ACD_5C00250G0004 [uncultured bacterium]|nr:MAG: hypothetical protein ACD_5C00250G0004 [uncultured bacterium]
MAVKSFTFALALTASFFSPDTSLKDDENFLSADHEIKKQEMIQNVSGFPFEIDIFPKMKDENSLKVRIPQENSIENIKVEESLKVTEVPNARDISSDVKKSNAVKKPASSKIGIPGPILSETKVVNGKVMCKDDNDKPKKSKKNPKGHVDSQCCLDPGETPNSNCYYAPEKYGALIQKYLNKK